MKLFYCGVGSLNLFFQSCLEIPLNSCFHEASASSEGLWYLVEDGSCQAKFGITCDEMKHKVNKDTCGWRIMKNIYLGSHNT